MKNGSKFEAQYQPCLATEPIRSNPWKWQAGEVGEPPRLILAVFQQFSPSEFLTKAGLRVLPCSQPTLQGR